MNVEGKTALVTGGAVRLGQAIVIGLAEAGARVVIHYRHSEEPARALQAKIRDAGGEAFLVQADLSSEAACAGLIDDAVARAGGLDILVNNAAVFNKDRLQDVTEQNVLGEFWPNLFAPLFLIRSFAARAGGGCVVNLLDQRIASHDPSCVPYLLAKKGLEELTHLAAIELAPSFAVNAVAPGAILPPPGLGPAYLKEHAPPSLLDAVCTEQDIAEAVLYLVRSNVVTGQTIFVDGGSHLLGS